MEEDKVEFRLKGRHMLRKTARRHGDSCHVYVPKAWLDKEVIVILVE